MEFAHKILCGYEEIWDKITTKISTATEEIKTWCNNTLTSRLASKADINHTHSASSISAVGFPNYSSATTIDNNYTASANGWIQYEGYRYSTGWVAINGRKVCHYSAHFSEESDGAAGVAPISKGDKVTKAGSVTVRFLPMK